MLPSNIIHIGCIENGPRFGLDLLDFGTEEDIADATKERLKGDAGPH